MIGLDGPVWSLLSISFAGHFHQENSVLDCPKLMLPIRRSDETDSLLCWQPPRWIQADT